MHTDSRTKLSRRKVSALEHFIKTLDKFDLLPPYIITAELKPQAYLNRWANIEYEKPEKVYGVVIRIISDKGYVLRITIDEDC